MIFGEPGRTDFDINFWLFGFHVRVHPAFFILPILLGRGLIPSDVNTGVGWLILIFVFFVSILVHELGHALAFRYYGIHSRIVLHWMGGVAIPESSGNVWAPRAARSLTPNQQIVVSLAGPIAGLLLAIAMMGMVLAVGGKVIIAPGMLPIPIPILEGTILGQSAVVEMIFFSGIILNVVLNVFNLIPIYPLDGGHIARNIMIQFDPREGLRNSIILSMVVAILVAVVAFRYGDKFLGFFFGYMAWLNYQMLQPYRGPRW